MTAAERQASRRPADGDAAAPPRDRTEHVRLHRPTTRTGPRRRRRSRGYNSTGQAPKRPRRRATHATWPARAAYTTSAATSTSREPPRHDGGRSQQRRDPRRRQPDGERRCGAAPRRRGSWSNPRREGGHPADTCETLITSRPARMVTGSPAGAEALRPRRHPRPRRSRTSGMASDGEVLRRGRRSGRARTRPSPAPGRAANAPVPAIATMLGTIDRASIRRPDDVVRLYREQAAGLLAGGDQTGQGVGSQANVGIQEHEERAPSSLRLPFQHAHGLPAQPGGGPPGASTVAPAAAATAAVPSSEPSSTTMIPSGGCVWAATSRRSSGSVSASLRAGITTASGLLVDRAAARAGSPSRPGRRHMSHQPQSQPTATMARRIHPDISA